MESQLSLVLFNYISTIFNDEGVVCDGYWSSQANQLCKLKSQGGSKVSFEALRSFGVDTSFSFLPRVPNGVDGSSCGRGIEVGASVLMGSRKRSDEKSLPDFKLWELLCGDFSAEKLCSFRASRSLQHFFGFRGYFLVTTKYSSDCPQEL